MRARTVPFPAARRFTLDLLQAAAGIPTVPVQRRMDLGEVAAARVAAGRPGWPALFLRAYGAVSDRTPALRRALVWGPLQRLVEYPGTAAGVAIEREHAGAPAVFFARILDPGKRPIADLDARLRGLAERPVEDVRAFRRLLALARLPGPVRRAAVWLGLNLASARANRFGTFGLSVYSGLGAESLHPISPLTTTLTYGVVGPDGRADVRLVYDHRVLDGATVARALAALEAELTGPVLAELRGTAGRPALRAA